MYPEIADITTDYIDISKVKGEFIEVKTDPKMNCLNVGAGITLNDFIDTMKKYSTEDTQNFSYGNQIVKHLKRVANVNVRNRGTLAGNLMLKHQHHEFPSDLFVLLEALEAKLIVESLQGKKALLPSEWLEESMDRKLLLLIALPKLDSRTNNFFSYKITPRRVNAHAYINVAIRFVIKDENLTVAKKPTIVCGGISEDFVHAKRTEQFLSDKSLEDTKTMKEAMLELRTEILSATQTQNDPLLVSVRYRIHLVQASLYKSIISVLGDRACPDLWSSSQDTLPRKVSKGHHDFVTHPEEWPMTEPVQKLEVKAQVSGEAEYVADIPEFPTELHAAYVVAAYSACEIDNVDFSTALNMKGVVSFVDYTDVPGKNSYFGSKEDVDEIFCSGKIKYAGQPIGLILAKSADIALKAARIGVNVTYKNKRKPIIDIKNAIKDPKRIIKVLTTESSVDNDTLRKQPKDVIEEEDTESIHGEIQMGSQYHFHMETQSVLIRPLENGEYDVYATSQNTKKLQRVFSEVLGIPANKINVVVRRLGGGFGAKIRYPIALACAAGIAASKLNCPIRMVMDLKTNMEVFGKRLPFLAKYNATISRSKTKLKHLSIDFYCDCGCTFGEETVTDAIGFAQNVYNIPSWKFTGYGVKTDTASNSYCRAPGSTQGQNITEIIMDCLAHKIDMDPLAFKINNFLKKGDKLINQYQALLQEENPLPDMLKSLIVDSDYETRLAAISNYNKKNKWRKKGISVVPCKYQIVYPTPEPYTCQISIYASDGSVSITHGGIEMGQGINTKVAQTVAKELGVPSLDFISVKPSNNFVCPNAGTTGGSIGSELVCYAASIASKQLRAKMEKLVPNPKTWPDMVKECYEKNLDLSSRHATNTVNDSLSAYFLWGIAMTEVELDVLTGEINVIRSDIVEDTGASISPAIDVGQVEGAFMFGLGLWTCEEIRFNAETGQIVTNDTWTYKPPAHKDIPEELNLKLIEGDRTKGLLGSKATGEPAVHMGVSVALAIRQALIASRRHLGQQFDSDWYNNCIGPYTLEAIQLNSGVTADDFYLYG